MKRVLIADPDVELVRQLGQALQAKGFEVLGAKDGSKALESSILKAPDIVLIDQNCPLINAQHFAAILRANPRTENTPLLVMLQNDDDGIASTSYLDGQILKPFNLDEVVGQVLAVAHKLDTAKAVENEDRAIVGNLSQIALVDLLQIFSMNRKTGRLSLTVSRGRGEITVEVGRILGASLSTGFAHVTGTKALFRLLEEISGEFSFSPVAGLAGNAQSVAGLAGNGQSTAASVDDGKPAADKEGLGETSLLVMEGLRQSDELSRLRQALPTNPTLLRLVPGDELLHELHPLTQRLLDQLAEPHTVAELLDIDSATDFEIAQALLNLLNAHLVEVCEQQDVPPRSNQPPLLPEALVLVLRGHLHRALIGSVSLQRPRLMLLSDDSQRLEQLLDGIRALSEFTPETKGTARYGYGTQGLLAVAPDLGFELVALPTRLDLLPLAIPLSMGALGVVALSGSSDESDGLDAYRDAMIGRLGVPWLEVSVDRDQAESSHRVDVRTIRGMLASLCRALTKSG